MSRLLTPDDIADALQIPRRAVLAMHRAGTLPGRRIGRRIRFHPNALAAFVNKEESP